MSEIQNDIQLMKDAGFNPAEIENYKQDFINIPTSDTIKLKFGNLCNLKCLTCGPYSSSRWAHERNTQNELNVYKELKDEISKASHQKYGKLYQESFDYEFKQDINKLNYNFDDNFYKNYYPNNHPSIICFIFFVFHNFSFQ